MRESAGNIERAIEDLRRGVRMEESFRCFFEAYYPRIRRFFLRRGVSPEESADLTQETFVGIYRGIGAYRRDGRFETWLFRIASNVHRKSLRHRRAEKRGAEEVPLGGPAERDEEGRRPPAAELAASDLAPVEHLIQAERSRRLRQAVDALPLQMRKCFVLRVYQGLKYREVAVAMRLSTETVKAHLFQARRRLQQELGEETARVAGEEPL